MRMQIYSGYANFIGPLSFYSGQSRLAHPGLDEDLQIAGPFWQTLPQPIPP